MHFEELESEGDSCLLFQKYDFLNVQSETRTCCGFRENMIRVANRPCDEVAFKWPVCNIFESLIQKCIDHEKPTNDWYYEDFAALVEVAKKDGKL